MLDSIKQLPDLEKIKSNPSRYHIVYLDQQRANFWRLLLQIYTTFVFKASDFKLYPYLSVQIASALGCAISAQSLD